MRSSTRRPWSSCWRLQAGAGQRVPGGAAPGKNIVYLGCLFLIIGVFAMLYVRDRRIWIWLTPPMVQPCHMALSTNRKTMDGDREFAMLAAS
jgi:cytochrome c biogenesis protein ResB